MDTRKFQETTLEKQQRKKPLTDRPWQSKLKDLLRPTLSKIAGAKVPYSVEVVNDCRSLDRYLDEIKSVEFLYGNTVVLTLQKNPSI